MTADGIRRDVTLNAVTLHPMNPADCLYSLLFIMPMRI
jgi:hypothetical protein